VDINFREIKRQDIEELVNVCSEIGGYKLRYENLSERVKEILKSQDKTVILALNEDNTIIAWVQATVCNFILSEKCCDISGLFVVSNYRGRKIGKKLIEQVFEWGKKQNCTGLRISSEITRIDAHNFYKHLGFKHIKTNKSYFRSLDD
jgi:GNAT superfamily N-acetyltransferase